VPPPTSGKMPESTTVLPASEFAGPSLPGRGMTNLREAEREEEEEEGTTAPEAEAAAPAPPADRPAVPAEGGDVQAGLDVRVCERGLSWTRRAQLAELEQKRASWRISSGLRAARPERSTPPIERSARANAAESEMRAGSGRPSQTRLGTRQHLRWTQPPYEPLSESSQPTRSSSLAMHSSAPQWRADPCALHNDRPLFARSTR